MSDAYSCLFPKSVFTLVLYQWSEGKVWLVKSHLRPLQATTITKKIKRPLHKHVHTCSSVIKYAWARARVWSKSWARRNVRIERNCWPKWEFSFVTMLEHALEPGSQKWWQVEKRKHLWATDEIVYKVWTKPTNTKSGHWESGKLLLQRDIFLSGKAVSEREVPWFEKHPLSNICVAF